MARCRCAFLASESIEPEGALARLLARNADLELLPVAPESFPSGPADIDVFVFVAGSKSLAMTLDQVAHVRSRHPGCAILLISSELAASELTALIAAGVYDFVLLPFSENEFQARLRRAIGTAPVSEPPKAPALADPRLRNFIGTSAVFVRQVERLPAIANCDAGVLLFGETGTGKEVFAQAIHYLSARTSKPCVAVNCGAIPVELIESEMFGHVKGAYTTAHANRAGLVREAEGGTLFLDDIDGLPLAAQAKLLRFLQEREYRPVGSSAVCRADVRVIAASNHRLSQMVARGEFRQDLYFRLNVLALHLPPLRERFEDIPELARHFMRQFAAQYRRSIIDLSPPAMGRLLAYDWPGNVRELKHVLERAVLLSTNPVIGAADIEFCGELKASPEEESFRVAKERVVTDFERNFIERLLLAHHGNVTHAAQAARKNRRAFFQLIRKHRIEPARFRAAQK